MHEKNVFGKRVFQCFTFYDSPLKFCTKILRENFFEQNGTFAQSKSAVVRNVRYREIFASDVSSHTSRFRKIHARSRPILRVALARARRFDAPKRAHNRGARPNRPETHFRTACDFSAFRTTSAEIKVLGRETTTHDENCV